MIIKKYSSWVCLAAIMICSFSDVFSVCALSEKQLNLNSQNSIFFYDPCSSPIVDDDVSIVPGDIIEDLGDNAKTILANLLNAGYSKEAAAAILANLQAESGLNPRILEGGKLVGDDFRAWDNGKKTFNGGFGIAQWTSAGRVKALQDYADSHGWPVTSLKAQVGYLLQELPGHKSSASSLNSVGLKESVFIVLRYFEGPAKVVYTHPRANNDYVPNSFSELDPDKTPDAYSVWKGRYSRALGFFDIEPGELIEPTEPPDEIIVVPNDDVSGKCKAEETGWKIETE